MRIQVDVCVVSVVFCDIVEDIGVGRFREDLYYCLNVVLIRVLVLRDLCGDIFFLVCHFICWSVEVIGLLVREIDEGVMVIL